jgi:hypothetical protein
MTRLSFFLFIHWCRRITLEPTFKDLEGYFIVRCYGDWEEGYDEWYSVSCESDGTFYKSIVVIKIKSVRVFDSYAFIDLGMSLPDLFHQ